MEILSRGTYVATISSYFYVLNLKIRLQMGSLNDSSHSNEGFQSVGRNIVSGVEHILVSPPPQIKLCMTCSRVEIQGGTLGVVMDS